jgi:PAT family beta-lactamase induction signal transducer AmpG
MAATHLKNWWQAVAVYRDPRVAFLILFGFSSGLPLALTASTLSTWLADVGVSLTAIGFFAAVATPYSLKFLWAPLVDRIRLPVVANLLGHRRSWMILIQICLIFAIIGLGGSNPTENPEVTAAFAILVAFLSATQDIVIDAYRVEILKRDQYAAGAATTVFGYRIAMLVSGAGALFLADRMAWEAVYLIMAAVQGVGILAVLLNPEPAANGSETLAREGAVADRLAGRRERVVAWIYMAVVAPFHEFMTRSGVKTAFVILAFVVFYKFGDALAGTMTNPFLIKIGFTKSEIAEVVKLFGFVATLVGLALGGVVVKAMGLFRALLLCGVLQLVSNLVFAVQAQLGADLGFLAVTIGFENLAGGMGSAVFIAYISALCNLAFTATQYALLSSLAVVGRTMLSTGGGALAEAVGWVDFFILTAVAAVPGLLILFWLRRLGLGLLNEPTRQ